MSVVHVRRIDPDVDLAGFAGDTGWLCARGGVGVAGQGTWRRCPPDQVSRELAGLGDKVVAIGARPFRPDAAWDLVIPRHQVRVDADGTAWETRIGTDDDTDWRPVPGTDAGAQDPPAAPTGVRVTPVESARHWQDAVARTTAAIRRGEADKVVIAREVVATAETALAPSALIRRLAHHFEGCHLFSVDGLVGASPELLVERTGSTVRSQPMAGTARRSPDPDTDASLAAELVASATYRQEHQLTIDMVYDTLLDFTSFVDFEPEPSIVPLANVFHLASRVEGRLTAPPASVLDLQVALHPTPAVSGRPRDAAIDLIARVEGRDRGRYAGTVGWVDGAGNGSWAVSIRCAQIDPTDPRRARIHAGCGLVGTSNPAREFAESEAKLQAMLSVLGD